MGDSDHKMPGSRCPKCHHRMDGAYNPCGAEAPAPGDITVCINCGGILAFDDALHLRLANDAELKEVSGREDFKRILGAISQTMTSEPPT